MEYLTSNRINHFLTLNEKMFLHFPNLASFLLFSSNNDDKLEIFYPGRFVKEFYFISLLPNLFIIFLFNTVLNLEIQLYYLFIVKNDPIF